jgi:ubiquinone/menaquinone biosynthesis C-methylase UbiE
LDGAVGVYRDRVLPRLLDRAMDTADYRRIRAQVCASLHGVVLEIGFGTGLNLPHLPAAITRLIAVEPSATGVAVAAERIAAVPAPVAMVGLDGQSIPVEDAAVDTALCTWTLCSVPDPVAAVRELRRVLRPGGTLHFVEHGQAPEESVRRWQHRLNGVQRRFVGGCTLDRDIPALIEAGGLAVQHLERYYRTDEPKVYGATYQGIAG